jgi:glycosyltransferase involved in cell wall biosynthesis
LRRNPKVSVIIPLFNKEKFIAQTLNSLLSQTFQDWECIIVDDGSDDLGPNIVSKYASSFPNRFRLIRQTKSGQAIARNVGIAKAVGEYIAFLDADDLWHPRKLYRQVMAMENEPTCDLLLSGYAIVGISQATQVVIPKNHKNLLKNWLYMEGYGGALESVGIIRKTVFSKISFDKQLSTSSGLHFYLQVAEAGRVSFTKDIEMVYRRYPGQWHTSLGELARNITLLNASELNFDHEKLLMNFAQWRNLKNVKSALEEMNLFVCLKLFRHLKFQFLILRIKNLISSKLLGLRFNYIVREILLSAHIPESPS